jgi:iron complex outermembrane receptor protein
MVIALSLSGRSMNRTQLVSVFSLALGIVGVALSSPSTAQAPSPASATEDNGGSSGLQEIIVTAEKRAESIQNVPAAISALDAQQIWTRGIQDVQDLQFQTPDFQAGNTVGVTQIAIRGVGMNLTDVTTQPGVAVYVDGIYQARTAATGLDQIDLQRIEVLRGAQGTLYGRNATGGAVNFITASPSNQFEAQVLAGYENFDEYHVQGLLNAPINDKLRVRLVFDENDQQDGFVKNVIPGNPDVADQKTFVARLKIAADLSDSATLDVAVDGSHGSGARDYLVSEQVAGSVGYGSLQTSANRSSSSDLNTWSASATFNWNLGAVKFKSLTGYASYQYDNAYDGDGTNLDIFAITDQYSSKTFTQEFNLSGASGGFDWLFGLFYMHDNLDLAEQFLFPSGFATLPPNAFLAISATPYETTSYAAFVDGTYHLTDHLKLLAGARYSKESQTVSETNAFGLQEGSTTIPLFAECADLTTKLDFDSFTPRGGLQYDFNDEKNAYFTVSRGFRAGGVNESACTDNTYDPEKITDYELGYRSRWLDNRLILNATAFYYDYTDFQVQQIVGFSSDIINAPSATIKGAEFEGVWAPDEHWALNANVSTLDSRYGAGFFNIDALNRAAGDQNLDGHYLDRAPKVSGNLGLQYRTGTLAFGRLTARADLYATEKYYFREFNTPGDTQDGFSILNLSMLWESVDGRYSARLFASNATDTHYLTTMFANENLATRQFTWGAPAQYGIEFKARFNSRPGQMR